MKRKLTPALRLILILTLGFSIQASRSDYVWSETIYIRADGSIEPLGAPVSTVDNVTYTLTDNIVGIVIGYSGAIAIERDNIVLDGAGYMLQGAGSGIGIRVAGRTNLTIQSITIKGFEAGIVLSSYSNHNSIVHTNITNNAGDGIALRESSNNSIAGNHITANTQNSIHISDSSNNSITANHITNNARGIKLYGSSSNTITENNVTANNGAGIWLNVSSSNSITENYISANNGCGVIFFYSSNNSVCRNNSTAQVWNGITLGYSSNNNISGNHIMANNKYGIHLYGSSNNNVSGNFITANFWHGIYLFSASGNSVYRNNMTANGGRGIDLENSSSNSITENNVTANNDGGIGLSGSPNNNISKNVLVSNGLYVWDSYENLVWNNTVNGRPLVYLESASDLTVGDDAGQVVLVKCNRILVENLTLSNIDIGIELWKTNSTNISKNNIANNDVGIRLWYSSNNSIYHNNLVDNARQIYSGHSSNSWDDGYPSGGNYWSNYTGVDENSDGIGDTSLDIDGSNRDRYPLMGMFSDFEVTSQNHVQTISNSLISCFQFNGTAIKFNATGEEGTMGFCRVLIPTALMNATYNVFVNGTEVTYTMLPFSNSTRSAIYFIYTHSTQEVVIVSEFPSIMILMLLFGLTTLIAVVGRLPRWKCICVERSNGKLYYGLTFGVVGQKCTVKRLQDHLSDS